MTKVEPAIWGIAVYIMGMWAIAIMPFFLLGGIKATEFNQQYFNILALIWTCLFLIGVLIYGLIPSKHKRFDVIIESVQDFFRKGVVHFGIILFVGLYMIALIIGLVRL
ncbi:MAG: hypothetical protein QW478_04670 [Candidatus Micrarchaeaceae archaeon]